jgi:hypothetical protein
VSPPPATTRDWVLYLVVYPALLAIAFVALAYVFGDPL